METQSPPPCLCVITGTTAINLGSIPLGLPSWEHLPPGHPSACPICPLAFLLQIHSCFPRGTKKRRHNRKHDSSQQFVRPTVCNLLRCPLTISFLFLIYLFTWNLLEKNKGVWGNQLHLAFSASHPASLISGGKICKRVICPFLWMNERRNMWMESKSVSHSVLSNSLRPHGL